MLKICGLPSQRIRFFSRLSIRKHKFSLTYTNFSAFSFLIKKNNDKIESRKDPKELIADFSGLRTFSEFTKNYKKHEKSLDQTSIIHPLKALVSLMNNKTSTLDPIYEETISKLIIFLKEKVFQMNEYALLECLIFIRFGLTNLFPKQTKELKEELLPSIISRIDVLIGSNKINLKISGAIFYEYSILFVDTLKIFQYIKNLVLLNDQQSYVTPFFIYMLFKSCVKSIDDKKKRFYADFCYKLLDFLEPHLLSLNLNTLIQIFKDSSILRIHENSSHKRLHPIIFLMKDTIIKRCEEFGEYDVLSLLTAFMYLPKSMDNKLQLIIKSNTLKTIYAAPHNLTTKFLIKYLDLMGSQTLENRLNHDSLKMIGDRIFKRFQVETNLTMSLLLNTIKAFSKNYYLHKEIFDFCYKRFLIEKKILTFSIAAKILEVFTDVQYDCNLYMLRIADFLLEDKTVVSENILLRFLYLYTLPSHIHKEAYNRIREFICKKLKENTEKDLDQFLKLLFLMKDYRNIKNEYFTKLLTTISEKMEEIWDRIDFKSRYKISLIFIDSHVPPLFWSSFLNRKMEKLTEESEIQTAIYLFQIEDKKTYLSIDFFLKHMITLTFESKKKFFKKIIDAILASPPEKLINKRGKANNRLRILLEEYPTNISLEEVNVRTIDILKLYRYMKILGLKSEFVLKTIKNEFKLGTILKDNKDFGFHVAEIGECLVENLETTGVSYHFEISNIIHAIFKFLTSNFESNAGGISLSWYTKYLRIYIFLYQQNKSNKAFFNLDQEMWRKLVEKIIGKVKEGSVSKGGEIKALFAMIKMEFFLQDGFENETREFIAARLKTSIDPHSLAVIVNYLDEWKELASSQFKIDQNKFKLYFNVIEEFFLNSKAPINYRNVICKYLNFFMSIGDTKIKLLNKFISEIEKNLKSFRIDDMIEIISFFSDIRLFHLDIYKSFSIKFSLSAQLIEQNIVFLINDYAKVGCMEKWCFEFIKTMWNVHEKVIIENHKGMRRPIQLLCSLEIYDLLKQENLLEKYHANAEYYMLKEYSFGNPDLNKYLYFLINIFELHNFAISDELKKILKENNILGFIFSKRIPEFEKILKEKNEDYLLEHPLSQHFKADLYLSKRNIFVIYKNSFYVNYDHSTLSGLGVLRNKIIQKYKSQFTIIEIEQCIFEKLGEEEKMKYLKGIGLDF